MTGESQSEQDTDERVEAHRQAYRQTNRQRRRRDNFAGMAAVGQIVCLLGVVASIALLLHGDLGVGVILLVMSVPLSVILYFTYFIATRLAMIADFSDAE